jgi:tRNA nucleotidyltransferase (CCA-adding enzyme)
MPLSEADRERYLGGDDARQALAIIARLHDAGFVAYLAGGCVRDALLGHPPKDYDVATNATPDAIRDLFGRRRTLAFGASFGVIGVLPSRREAADRPAEPIEVATFRSDGTYSDGRRPDSVHFGDAEQDALRRDFTINGLFYDPRLHKIVDYVGGQADLEAGILRTIGNAATRIEEDKLRMLRAVRFATTLGFAVEPMTLQAIRTHAGDIRGVSGERIGAEMRRVLVSPNALVGLDHLHDLRLDRPVLPEFQGIDRSRYQSLVNHLRQRDFPSALACLVISLAQPLPSLAAIGRRWRLSGEEIRKATAAVDRMPVILNANSRDWSAVQPVLIDRDVDTVLAVAEAMVAAADTDDSGVRLARQAVGWPPERLDPPPLITGEDLKQLKIPAGPIYRSLLQQLRDAQLDGRIANRDDAMAMLEGLLD